MSLEVKGQCGLLTKNLVTFWLGSYPLAFAWLSAICFHLLMAIDIFLYEHMPVTPECKAPETVYFILGKVHLYKQGNFL